LKISQNSFPQKITKACNVKNHYKKLPNLNSGILTINLQERKKMGKKYQKIY